MRVAPVVLRVFSISVIVGIAASSAAFGAGSPAQLTANYTIAARAKLVITPATVTFPDLDPTAVPLVSATENPVQVTASFRKNPSAAVTTTLTCVGGPLTSGANTIPAGNIQWTASGTGFSSGTVNSTTPQNVGSWTASGAYTGNLNFQMTNLWTYATGTYTGSMTCTLTAQ